MKIELNKSYRTRSGKKCRIICVDVKFNTRSGSYPVLGLLDVGDHECTFALTLYGKLYAHRESDHDLIAEWQEPKPRLLAWICADNFQGDGTPLASTGFSVQYFEYGKSPNYGRRAPWLDEPEEGGVNDIL